LRFRFHIASRYGHLHTITNLVVRNITVNNILKRFQNMMTDHFCANKKNLVYSTGTAFRSLPLGYGGLAVVLNNLGHGSLLRVETYRSAFECRHIRNCFHSQDTPLPAHDVLLAESHCMHFPARLAKLKPSLKLHRNNAGVERSGCQG
jgi:hypothetical protein